MSRSPANFDSPLIGSFHVGAMIGRGKEGATYRIATFPHLVAKIYHSPPSSKTIRKLEVMISSPPVPVDWKNQRPVLAWPQALVHNSSGAVCGFLMPVVEPTWSFNKLFFPEQRAKLRTSTNTAVGWHHLHVIAGNLARVVSACHDSGYVIGDLNNHNVRVYSDGRVCLIDTDSFQVIDRSQRPPVVHHCEVVFPDYAPPELIGENLSRFDRAPTSDCYALATLIFMLLQDGMHPFGAETNTDPPLDPSQVMQVRGFPYLLTRSNQSIRPYPKAPSFGRLHPQLRELFVRTFTLGLDSPQGRPSAEQWERALATAHSELRKCSRGHYFVATQNVPCLHIVAVHGGGLCGSTESVKATTPIPFDEISPISGARAIRVNSARTAPPIVIPPQQPPPSPQPPAASSGTSKSHRSPAKGSLKKRLIGLGILCLLGWGFYQDLFNETNGISTELPALTPIAQNSTRVPTREPTTARIVTITSAPTHTPTEVPTVSNDPPTSIPTTIPTQGVPAAIELPWGEVVSATQSLESLIYSRYKDGSWSLCIANPSTGQFGVIADSLTIDPSPALSNSGDRLAFLASSDNGYSLRLLNFADLSIAQFNLTHSTQPPLNLEWMASDDSLLVTILSNDEPQIAKFDTSLETISDFLPPWSANPSVSSRGSMAYVVPEGNDPFNLGIVLADTSGIASEFIADGEQTENFPELSSGADLMTFDVALPDNTGHVLGIVDLSGTEPLLVSKVSALSIQSDTPVRTYWFGDNRLAIGFCVQGSCGILTIAADGSPEAVFSIQDTDALGNIILRP